MKYFLYILLLSSILFTQDRSTLFSTGNPPDLGVGWDIRCNNFSSNDTGDINDDDNIDVLDIVSLVNLIMGEEEYNILADLNEDGLVNVLDIVMMINGILSPVLE